MFLASGQYLSSAPIDSQEGLNLRGGTHVQERLILSSVFFPPAPAVKPDRHHHVARSEDGRLFYDNQWFCRGQAVSINKKDEYPTRWVSESGAAARGRKRLRFASFHFVYSPRIIQG